MYFLSSQPCELTLNGVFFGITDAFERFAELSLSDHIFAKFTPQGAMPIGLFLDEQLLVSPPDGFEVYLLKNGVALYAKDFPPTDLTLQPIAQARFGNNLITVFRQGVVHVSLETSEGFFISTLPHSFTSCTLSLYADIFFIDENGCTQTKFALRQSRTFDGDTEPKKLNEELLPYAFFESVLLGANYAEFLSEELAAQAKHIVEFLGDFKAVTLTEDPNTLGLVREKAPRLFTLSYFTVETKNGKIIDVKG